jgi:N-succinyldiaminopimelate aminotransferase
VVAVPTEVFYALEHAALGRHLVRFAFCKQEEVLGEAVARLRRMR